MAQKKVTSIPAGMSGQFINGYQLFDKSYTVSSSVDSTSPVKIGTFACKATVDNECIGQKGDGEVIGFVMFQDYKSSVDNADTTQFNAGDSVQIEIGNMAIYALDVGDTTGIKKDNYIGIKKDDGTLYFNADKTTATTGDYKDTGYKVFQTNDIKTPGVIYIKKV